MISSILETSTSSSNTDSKKAFKHNLINFINETSVPVYLKKDMIIYYLKKYIEKGDLQEIKFDSLLVKING